VSLTVIDILHNITNISLYYLINIPRRNVNGMIMLSHFTVAVRNN